MRVKPSSSSSFSTKWEFLLHMRIVQKIKCLKRIWFQFQKKSKFRKRRREEPNLMNGVKEMAIQSLVNHRKRWNQKRKNQSLRNSRMRSLKLKLRLNNWWLLNLINLMMIGVRLLCSHSVLWMKKIELNKNQFLKSV